MEVGCDEAGRGCLAGPVVAAAVVLDPKNPIKGLDDSKKITEKRRLELLPEIKQKALGFGIGICSPEEIDEVNILNASFLAMHKALQQIDENLFNHILVDGNRFTPYLDVPYTCMIKGDGRFQSIAAASILAKTHRDEIMEKLHGEFPEYAWDKNKGYPTKAHRKAIAEIGPCLHHRQSFQLLPVVQGRLFE